MHIHEADSFTTRNRQDNNATPSELVTTTHQQTKQNTDSHTVMMHAALHI